MWIFLKILCFLIILLPEKSTTDANQRPLHGRPKPTHGTLGGSFPGPLCFFNQSQVLLRQHSCCHRNTKTQEFTPRGRGLLRHRAPVSIWWATPDQTILCPPGLPEQSAAPCRPPRTLPTPRLPAQPGTKSPSAGVLKAPLPSPHTSSHLLEHPEPPPP